MDLAKNITAGFVAPSVPLPLSSRFIHIQLLPSRCQLRSCARKGTRTRSCDVSTLVRMEASNPTPSTSNVNMNNFTLLSYPQNPDISLPHQLALLPFPLHDAMLPGETKQLHLYEARFLTLFEHALLDPSRNMHIAQLLITSNNNVLNVCPVIRIVEWERREIGVWAKVVCYGRMKVRNVVESEYEYLVCPDPEVYIDKEMNKAGGKSLVYAMESLSQKMDKVAATCFDLANKIHEIQYGGTSSVKSDETVLGEDISASNKVKQNVEWTHESNMAGLMDGSSRYRQATLESRLDKFKSSLLISTQPISRQLNDMNDDHSENGEHGDTMRQYLLNICLKSFAFSSLLDTTSRVQSLLLLSIQDRVSIGLACASQDQSKMAAELAIHQVGRGSGSGSGDMNTNQQQQ